MENKDNVKVSIVCIQGTPRQVADRARTTIGLGLGDKIISPKYMRKLYICEHSPIRMRSFVIRIENIPYWIAMHFVRHHIGVTPFVSTQRDDRNKNIENRDEEPQGNLVTLELHANSQALINMSRKRLCNSAHVRTREIWKEVIYKLREEDESLTSACVRECVYRGFCPEFNSCGFARKDNVIYNNMLEAYRRDNSNE